MHVDRKGYHLSLDAVPAWVCAQCGEPYFEGREVDSVQRLLIRHLPQLQVASYSLLLLASLLSSGFKRGDQHLPLPKWRRLSDSARPSLLDMLNLLRQQIFARNLDSPVVSFEPFTNTAPDAVKASKLPLAAETLTSMAA